MKPLHHQEYEHPIRIGLLGAEFDGIVDYEVDQAGDINLLRVFAYISPKRGEVIYGSDGEQIKWPSSLRQDIRWEFVSAAQQAEWKREIELHWLRLADEAMAERRLAA